MNVGELIKILSEQDPDRIVVVSRDAEGNSYSPLSGLWTGTYVADTTWSGSIGLEGLSDELQEAGYTEEDVAEDGQPAIVLQPVN